MFQDELLTMIRAGAGLIVGTVDAHGEPRATRAWGALVPDGVPDRIRVAVTADDEVTLANLAGGLVAITGADVRTLRSVQVKGRVVGLSPPSADEVALVDRQTEAFLAGVHETDGNPLEALRRMLPGSIVVIDVDVGDAYDQTPGPGAGDQLRSVPS